MNIDGKLAENITNCAIIALGIFGATYAAIGLTTGCFTLSELPPHYTPIATLVATFSTIFCCVNCKDKL